MGINAVIIQFTLIIDILRGCIKTSNSGLYSPFSFVLAIINIISSHTFKLLNGLIILKIEINNKKQEKDYFKLSSYLKVLIQ